MMQALTPTFPTTATTPPAPLFAGEERRAPRIVAIGGGTGLPAVLRGIAQAMPIGSDAHLTAVVTVTDDGGSSGRLRETLGVLPPGDIRNCLGALVRHPSALASILHHRVPTSDGHVGHPIGNLLLAALTSTEGNLLRAADVLGSQLGVAGRVLPATLDDVHLKALFDDGSNTRGETAIVARRGRIRRLMLERPVRPVAEVIEAIVNADLIVVGPGSLYTSILPNLLVGGVAATLSAVKGTRIYVANLMTQPGETDGYSVEDHLRVLQEHTGHQLFDHVLVNSAPIPSAAVAAYVADGARVVDYENLPPLQRQPGEPCIAAAALATITANGQIRHEPLALGRALLEVAEAQRRSHPE